MQIGTQKNGRWLNCEMVDHFYSVAIQVNLLHNIMADKTVWRSNDYSCSNTQLSCKTTHMHTFTTHIRMYTQIYMMYVQCKDISCILTFLHGHYFREQVYLTSC